MEGSSSQDYPVFHLRDFFGTHFRGSGVLLAKWALSICHTPLALLPGHSWKALRVSETQAPHREGHSWWRVYRLPVVPSRPETTAHRTDKSQNTDACPEMSGREQGRGGTLRAPVWEEEARPPHLRSECLRLRHRDARGSPPARGGCHEAVWCSRARIGCGAPAGAVGNTAAPGRPRPGRR